MTGHRRNGPAGSVHRARARQRVEAAGALIWAHAAVGVPWFNQIQRSPAISCWAHAVFAIVFGHSAHPHLKHLTCSRSALRSAVIQVPTIVFISSTVMAKRPRHKRAPPTVRESVRNPDPCQQTIFAISGESAHAFGRSRDADRRANLALEATGRVGAVAAFEGLRKTLRVGARDRQRGRDEREHQRAEQRGTHGRSWRRAGK